MRLDRKWVRPSRWLRHFPSS